MTVETAAVIEVICVRSHKGRGTEEDPHRIITTYFATEGTRLVEIDDWKHTQLLWEADQYRLIKQLEASK